MKLSIKLAVTATLIPFFAFAEVPTSQMEHDIKQLKIQIKKLEQTLENQKISQIPASNNAEIKKHKENIEDKEYPTFKLSGSADLDAGYAKKISNDNKSGFATRALKTKVKGELMKDLSYVFEVDFAGNRVNVKKANIARKLTSNQTITVGKFSEEFGLDYDNKFPESSILFSIVKYTGNGMKYSVFGDKYYTAVSYTNSHFDDRTNKNDARAATFRTTYAPLQTAKNTFAVGVSYSYNKPKNIQTEYTYDQNLETKLSENLLDHSETNVKHQAISGADLIYVTGPFAIQGEYIGSRIYKNDNKKLYFFGNYIQASYSFTGENISYNNTSGSFNGIEPTNPFDVSKKHYGAWELAFRYSMLNLNSGLSRGGKMKSYSTSLNWYLNKNMNVKFNYITGKTDSNAKVANARPKIYMVKLGVKF